MSASPTLMRPGLGMPGSLRPDGNRRQRRAGHDRDGPTRPCVQPAPHSPRRASRAASAAFQRPGAHRRRAGSRWHRSFCQPLLASRLWGILGQCEASPWRFETSLSVEAPRDCAGIRRQGHIGGTPIAPPFRRTESAAIGATAVVAPLGCIDTSSAEHIGPTTPADGGASTRFHRRGGLSGRATRPRHIRHQRRL
jgi:hypothetical protein